MLDTSDKKWLSTELRNAVRTVLTEERLVRNLPVEDEKEGRAWTFAEVLAAGDRKDDQAGRGRKVTAGELDALAQSVQAVEQSQTRILELLSKLVPADPA